MSYISAYFTPFVSGCPVTSAVIFAVCDCAQARMKISEIVPRPMAAQRTGFREAPIFWAYDGMQVHANARAESLVKLRCSMSQQFTRMTPRSRAPERFLKLANRPAFAIKGLGAIFEKVRTPLETKLHPPLMSIRWYVSRIAFFPASCTTQ